MTRHLPTEKVLRRTADRSAVLGGLSYLAVLLVIHRDLFLRPIIEYGDYAANAIQIQNAKHFQELLGNYSRWGFHHPGPGFFYLFALGEFVFRDCLRLVPAALNAHLLTILIVNTAFLFTTLAIFARHCQSALIVPAGTATAMLVTGSINSALPGSALLAIWIPHVLLCCFLLYVTSCAALASGQMRYLPLATLTGLLLLHGHVAQFLFVPAIALATLVMYLLRARRAEAGICNAKIWHRQLWISVALVALFALPPCVELAVHRPNNLDAVLAYTRAEKGVVNTWTQVFRYEESFFTFVATPEDALAQSSSPVVMNGKVPRFALIYWGCAALLLAALTLLKVKRRIVVSCFVRSALLLCILVSLLFLYWGRKMAGGLLNFNGHFFYSVQIIALLCVLAILLDSIDPPLQGEAIWLACLTPCLMFALPLPFDSISVGQAEVDQISNAVQGQAPLLHIAFTHDDWPIAIGLASRLKRVGQPFCVESGWGVMFGTDVGCVGTAGGTRLILTHKALPCAAACRVVFHNEKITAELSPYPRLALPFTIRAEDFSGLMQGFDSGDAEDDPAWTSRSSSVRFNLAADFTADARLRMQIVGVTLPGRPVAVLLNGQAIGTIAAGAARVAEFTFPASLLRGGAENDLTLKTPNAGPVGQDPRQLGFLLEQVQITGAR